MTWLPPHLRAPAIRGAHRAVVARQIEALVGRTNRDVADLLGISPGQAKRLREAYGLPGAPVGRPRRTEEDQ